MRPRWGCRLGLRAGRSWQILVAMRKILPYVAITCQTMAETRRELVHSAAMETTTRQERAARIRAAIAYSDRDQKDLAEQLGISVTTLSRYENGKSPVDDKAAVRILTACGVPEWFLEHGFQDAPEPEAPSVAERVEAIGHQLESLRGDLERRAETLSTQLYLADTRLSARIGALEQRLEEPHGEGAGSQG